MKTISVLVEGGKATAAPPLGPTLAQLKLNINNVIEEINKATKDFSGMQVPVKIHVDEKTKEFKIEVGTPPVSQLIKKELGVEKLAGLGKGEKGKRPEPVGSLTIDQIIKIAKLKTNIPGDLKKRVKQILGTCLSCGVLVENKNPKEVIKEIEGGIYDDKLIEEESKNE
jgi:large subunit ribosomal protein L11